MYPRAMYYVIPLVMITSAYTYAFDAVSPMSNLSTNTSVPSQQLVCAPDQRPHGASEISPETMFPTLKDTLSPSSSKKNPATGLFPDIDTEQSPCTLEHETCPNTHVSNMPYPQYFKTLATAMWAANRRYFVPEIRALINADHGVDGLITGHHPDKNSLLWQAHNDIPWGKDTEHLMTIYEYVATRIGSTHLCKAGSAHRVARWFAGETAHYSKAPLDDNNQITNQALGSVLPKESVRPETEKHFMGLWSKSEKIIVESPSDPPQFKPFLGISRTPSKEHQESISLDQTVQGIPLINFFDTCAHKYKLYKTTPREAISEQEETNLQNTCSRKEAIQKLRTYAQERYKYSTGTNPRYQKELKAMIDSDEPDQVFIHNNIRR